MSSRNSYLKELQTVFKTHRSIGITAHTSNVHSVGWSCDGRLLASGSVDRTVALCTLDESSLKKENVLRGHTGSIDQLCWHNINPNFLTTASLDKTVRIWDVRAATSAKVIPTKGQNINITWSPDGNAIAVGNKDDLVTFIDTRMNAIITEKQFEYEVNEIAWNNNGDSFFLTSGLGSVHILDYPNLNEQQQIKAHPATCICIKFDRTGKYFAVSSADACVSLWYVDELVCFHVLSRMVWPVRAISFSFDGKLVAVGSEDLHIEIDKVEKGELVMNVPVDGATFSVAWHPTKYLLAYSYDVKDIIGSRREVSTLKVFGFFK